MRTLIVQDDLRKNKIVKEIRRLFIITTKLFFHVGAMFSQHMNFHSSPRLSLLSHPATPVPLYPIFMILVPSSIFSSLSNKSHVAFLLLLASIFPLSIKFFLHYGPPKLILIISKKFPVCLGLSNRSLFAL